jgi:hypothetical protein
VYDTLLFLHVLSAFTFSAAIVMFSAYVLGAPLSPEAFSLSGWLWDVGGLAVLVFGVWLAFNVDSYDIFDGWIIAAIVLWAAAAGTGVRARELLRPAITAGAGAAAEAGAAVRHAATLHWVRTALAVLLLVDMVWKPGA